MNLAAGRYVFGVSIRWAGGRGGSDASDAQHQRATEAAGHESSLNKGPWGIGLWKPACTVVGGRMY